MPRLDTGSEFVVDEPSESLPSNETTARPFSALVTTVGRLEAVD